MTRSCISSFVLVLGCSGAAAAQTPAPAQPQTGARARATTDVRLTSSIFGSYGDPEGTGAQVGPPQAVETGGNAALLTRRQGDRTRLSTAVSSSLRRLSAIQRGSFWSHLASVRLDVAPVPRTAISIDAGGGYSEFSPFAARQENSLEAAVAEQISAADFGLPARETVSYNGGAQVGREVTTRSSVMLRVDARRTRGARGLRHATDEYQGQLGLANRFRHRAALRVSYGFLQGEYERVGTPRRVMHQHSVNVAFDREWAHTPTRQSVLHLALGPSAVVESSQYRYLATGEASINTQLSRSWLIGAGLARDMGLLDGTATPFVSDSARAQVQLRFGSKVDLVVMARAARGNTPFATFQGSYRSYGGTARLSWTFARTFSLYGELVNTHYELSDGAVIEGLADRGDRRSVRAGLSWDLGLKGRRSTNAAR